MRCLFVMSAYAPTDCSYERVIEGQSYHNLQMQSDIMVTAKMATHEWPD